MASAGISGMGIVSAIGNNVAETAARLYDADPVLPQQPARITTGLRRPVFEVSTDAEHRIPLTFLMQALTEALADARLTPEILKTKRVGVAVGTTVACQLDNLPCYARLRTAEDNDPADTEQCIRNYMEGIPAEYIRDLYGLNGPAITVSNACASGADAAMIALNWLRTGECDLVIAGGCDSVSKVAFSGFNALRVSSPEPCTPFDADRTGLNLGDGAGVVILEDPASAAERGVSVTLFLAGAGKTADAFHITQPESAGAELENAIRIALCEAETETVDFVNAHGTGTPANDRVESSVLYRLFGKDVHFHSTKAMTGHTLGAAGTIELILTALMLRNRKTAPSHRFGHPSDDMPVAPDTVPLDVPGNVALSTSLAFGGSNTALVIGKNPGKTQSPLPFVTTVDAFTEIRVDEDLRRKQMDVCRKYGLRRLDSITLLSLLAADEAAGMIPGFDSTGTALITVTSFGPAVTTGRNLDDILDFPEEQILPTGFSHSVLNAPASYIGSALKIHGPTFAIAGFKDPFLEAVKLGRSLLAGNRCSRVMIVAADENSIISRAAERCGLMPPAVYTEGAYAIILSRNGSGKELVTSAGSSSTEQLLPCGVPAGLPEMFANQGRCCL